VFQFNQQENDDVILQDAEDKTPLIVRRGQEVIVNFDIMAIQSTSFADSKRPIYTYIPGFNIQSIPEGTRRTISNFVQSLKSHTNRDIISRYSKLPVTNFEFVVLLLNKIVSDDSEDRYQVFRWPCDKRAVFISLHDIDTGGFLQRRESDLLFRIEQKHQVRATWFVPTGLLKENKKMVEFLLQTGNEIGWHGHNHDHRLPFRPFAEQRARELKKSFLTDAKNFPMGMRTPKLLKSNHLFEALEQSCPALCYDTSFQEGIVPYYLWLYGRKSKILEIPTTVPTDIAVYNQLSAIPRYRRPEMMLKLQIIRTKKLLEIGGIISIVTHPEKHLTERPDFLEVYDQYLTFVKSCPDIWFTTAGELFRYWTGNASRSKGQM
jgi:peptidoglycan/xylan/chitin deacetylase (PgdA/CDA1 family)